jgi:hypothetical protein
VRIEALAYFCREGESCRVGSVLFTVPVEVAAPPGGGGAPAAPAVPVEVLLEHRFTPAAPSPRLPPDAAQPR